ncbi:uncharacterized protein BO97DRAFT_446257 [Aspergillus homomorphus CBS 101889]|uniref:Uncharacterized protein n=1 Tax=Aspergillus homomorphus (strain CBS 101889) TaxID=1450537 RepID=A0A395HQ36_ASPHC|nr:hypothetical protein BO97DRAFT_446257 [Aspergillus homomorphus CBS 101889]RAL08364.1 hypothetical protein BO97DRAFT_446257 [Aspergillus homomorphus CBS 101889]
MPRSTRHASRLITRMQDEPQSPDPTVEDTPTFKSRLEELHSLCKKLYHKYDAPRGSWRQGDPPPVAEPEHTKGRGTGSKVGRREAIELWSTWPLVSGIWNPIQDGWPPYGVRLTDAWMYLAAKHLSNSERHKKFPGDFDQNGLIRQSRLPSGPTYLVSAHGMLVYPIYKGYYVLCGEAGRKYCTWLLQSQSEAVGNKFSFKSIIVGPVIPPTGTRSTHVFELQRHVPLSNSGTDAAAGLVSEEPICWTVFLNDMVLKYNRPNTYRIVPFAQLKPHPSCTGSPRSDKLVNRPGGLPTASNPPASTDVSNPAKQIVPVSSPLRAATPVAANADCPGNPNPAREAVVSTSQVTVGPRVEILDVKRNGKRSGMEDSSQPGEPPSTDHRHHEQQPTSEIQDIDGNDRKRRRTAQDRPFLSGLRESIELAKKRCAAYIASAKAAEKLHEQYLESVPQREEDHNAYVESALGAVNHIEECAACLWKELGDSGNDEDLGKGDESAVGEKQSTEEGRMVGEVNEDHED